MTSIHTQLPKDYYSLPFCVPNTLDTHGQPQPQSPQMESESLGEFLTGQKIQNSPYEIRMLKDVSCDIVCQTGPLTRVEADGLRAHIKYGYHHNWIVDNLPSAAVVGEVQVQQGRGDGERGEQLLHYGGGFPIGVLHIDHSTNDESAFDASLQSSVELLRHRKYRGYDAYVYNHVNIILQYHQHTPRDGSQSEGYRIVGFSVEPLSINHSIRNANVTFVNGEQQPTNFIKPPQRQRSDGTSSFSAPPSFNEYQRVNEGETILYTYDVIWSESSVRWANRWDLYLTENHLIPAKVHWKAVNNSIVMVLALSAGVIAVLVRNLKRDIAIYNASYAAYTVLPTNMNPDGTDNSNGYGHGVSSFEEEAIGWKVIHADVFRPPTTYPILFCVFCGSGVQIAIATGSTIGLSAVGCLSPARRGSLLNALLLLYAFSGTFAGYTSAMLYKSFRGRRWQLCTFVTAVFFPGMCFGFFLIFNTLLASVQSSGSVPFLDIAILTGLWSGIALPCVFFGAYFGYRRSIWYPTVTSPVPRTIPHSPIVSHNHYLGLIVGIIPFASIYLELYFIMTSLWMNQFYYVFGFTLLVFLLLIITTAEITILFLYYQFLAENHRWQWLAFLSGGSTGLYVMLFSVVWERQLQPSGMVLTHLLYFGYMFLISFATFLVTGTTGFVSCLWFTRTIFGSIKVD